MFTIFRMNGNSDEAVLDAYHQQLSQKDGMQKDEAPAPEEAKARQGLAMTM